MKTTLAFALLTFVAACHHHKDATGPQGGGMTDTSGGGSAMASGSGSDVDDAPAVDPTMPSWAPRSCYRYHAIVVRALACNEIAQGTRDEIKGRYEGDHAKWQASQDLQQGAISDIGKACLDQFQSVRTTFTSAACKVDGTTTPTP